MQRCVLADGLGGRQPRIGEIIDDTTKGPSKCNREGTTEEEMNSEHHKAARHFRELNGTVGLEQTLDKAVGALYRAAIPHFVTGGYAAQEYGCLRHTDNIDLIVPDIARAVAVLRGSGFQPHASSQTIVIDAETRFEVRLHSGGSMPDQGESGDNR